MKPLMIFLAIILISCGTSPTTYNDNIEQTVETSQIMNVDTVWTSSDSLYFPYFGIPAHGVVFEESASILNFASRYVVMHMGNEVELTHYWSRDYDLPRLQYVREETYVGLEEEDNLFIIKKYELISSN